MYFWGVFLTKIGGWGYVFWSKNEFRDRKVDVLNFLKSLNLILKLDHYEAIPNMIYTM
jgi:hypothetical protein